MSTPVPAHSQPGAPKLPPMPKPVRERLWHRTPPAIFPPILGLFGLGLGWRRAVSVLHVPPFPGEMILGAVVLLYLFALGAYLLKFSRRPAVFGEDLHTLPGRAGLSTLTMSGMLMAAALAPHFPDLARAVLGAALLGHLAVALGVIAILWPLPLKARRMTPVWHLTFVGFIVGPVAGVPLGWATLSDAIFWAMLAAALTIWIGHGLLLLRGGMPAPLRPTLAIHLSPAAVLGIVAALLGYKALALVLALLSIAIMAWLLARIFWITEAGFSPFWGAFTFPLAAFANLMMLMIVPHGAAFRILGAVALVAATLLIPWIAYRVMKMWFGGQLAVKTNAASI